MARLDKAVRDTLVDRIREGLPPGWTAIAGSGGHAFIKVDQDGNKASNKFNRIGTFVFMVEHQPDGAITATLFERVKCPPGYAEARKKVRVFCTLQGRGWRKQLLEAIAAQAIEQDTVFEERKAAAAARAEAREAKKKKARMAASK